MVEFALVLPILALILLSIVQLAFIFGTQIGVTNAVREAARFAATTTPTKTPAQATANGTGVYDQLTNATTGLLRRNVWFYNAADLVTVAAAGDPDTMVCYRPATDTASKNVVFVKVEAQYRHELFIPLVAGILDGIDGTPNDGLRVGASEEMRVENDEMLTQTMSATCYNP